MRKASEIKEDTAMTHSEKRVYLIKELLSEMPQYRDMDIPAMQRNRNGFLEVL